MQDYKIDILAEGLNFPEGPVFDKNGELWCTELLSGNLIHLNHRKRMKRYKVGENVNGLAIDAQGKFWYTDSQKHTINIFYPETGKVEVVVTETEGEKLNRPNDLIFDQMGNLIVSCHADGREEQNGYLMVVDTYGKTKKISVDKFFTNGITFWSNQNTMIFSETYAQRIWKATWDAESATIKQEEPWVEVGGPTGPDGLTTDERDQVYVTVFGKGLIKVVNKVGIVVKEYKLPGKRPTSCMFNPADPQELIVTEAEKSHLLKLTLL